MKELENYAKQLLAPKKKQSVNEWCEEEIIIPVGPFAGQPYRNRNAPYLAFILEQVKNPTVKKITLQWATQVGKTTALILALAWSTKNDPSTALWVTAIEKDAKSISKNQWQPIIEASPELSALIPTKNKDEVFQNLEQKFINGSLVYWVGAGSSNALSSRAIRLLCCDEVRSYKDNKDEADSLSLALNRVKSFPNHKILLASSPTTEGAGINFHYSEGSQHHFELPCPHCGGYQALDFDHLKWNKEAKDERGKWDKKKVKSSVYYECKHCSGEITEAHKTKMLRGGKWVQTNFEALDEHLSFHLSSLYSVNLSWSEIALKFLEAKESINGLKDFRQNFLGLPWVEKLQQIDNGDGFLKLQKTYERRTNPINGNSKVLMAIDVQRQTLKYVVRAFNDEESYLIDADEVVSWDKIRELEKQFGVEYTIIDSGYGERTNEVYEEIFKSDYKWFAAKGRAQNQMNHPYEKKLFDPFTGKRNQGRYKIVLVQVNDGIWKHELIDRLQGGKNWWIYDNPDFKYTSELGNEFPIEIENPKTGKTTIGWKKTGDNDWFDCEKYLLCLYQMLKGKPDAKAAEPEKKRVPISARRPLGGQRL